MALLSYINRHCQWPTSKPVISFLTEGWLINKTFVISYFNKDFLICIEMFLASIAHMLAFPATPYKTSSSSNWAIISNIANAANITDLHEEVSSHYGHFHNQVKRAFKKSLTASSSYNDMGASSSERSNLISNVGEAANNNENNTDNDNDTDSFCEEDDIGPRLMRIRSLSCEASVVNETKTVIQWTYINLFPFNIYKILSRDLMFSEFYFNLVMYYTC